MKKYLFIIGFAGMALFSACSTSDDLTAEEPHVTPPVEDPKENTLIAEARQDSEVPITLGIGEGRGNTRAPFDNETDFDTPDGQYIGVFCLATDYQSSYATNPPIENNWKDDNTGLSVRMKNVPAKVKDGDVTFLDPATLSDLTPTSQEWYYPMGNWMKYNFYTYYPWQNEDDDTRTLVINKSQISEKFYTFDGSQDIIWGIANPPVDDAFSAKYFIENSSAEIPQFSFKHKLAQFRFFVKAADGDASTLAGLSAQVTDMYIANAIYRLQLIVADKNNSGNNGELYWYGTTFDKALKNMSIKASNTNTNRFPGTAYPVDGEDADSEPDWVEEITDFSNPVGYIMLANPTVRQRFIQHPENPDPDPSFKYQLVLKLSYTKNAEDKEKTITMDMVPPTDGFLEGMIYNIVINIKSSDLE